MRFAPDGSGVEASHLDPTSPELTVDGQTVVSRIAVPVHKKHFMAVSPEIMNPGHAETSPFARQAAWHFSLETSAMFFS